MDLANPQIRGHRSLSRAEYAGRGAPELHPRHEALSPQGVGDHRIINPRRCRQNDRRWEHGTGLLTV